MTLNSTSTGNNFTGELDQRNAFLKMIAAVETSGATGNTVTSAVAWQD